MSYEGRYQVFCACGHCFFSDVYDKKPSKCAYCTCTCNDFIMVDDTNGEEHGLIPDEVLNLFTHAVIDTDTSCLSSPYDRAEDKPTRYAVPRNLESYRTYVDENGTRRFNGSDRVVSRVLKSLKAKPPPKCESPSGHAVPDKAIQIQIQDYIGGLLVYGLSDMTEMFSPPLRIYVTEAHDGYYFGRCPEFDLSMYERSLGDLQARFQEEVDFLWQDFVLYDGKMTSGALKVKERLLKRAGKLIRSDSQ